MLSFHYFPFSDDAFVVIAAVNEMKTEAWLNGLSHFVNQPLDFAKMPMMRC